MFNSVRISGRGRADVLVLGALKSGGKDPKPTFDRDSAAFDEDGAAKRAIGRREFTGDVGQMVEAHPEKNSHADRIIVVGLGESGQLKSAAMRKIAAAVGRRLGAINATSAQFELTKPLEKAKYDVEFAGRNVGEAMGLLSFDRTGFKGSATPKNEFVKLALRSSDKAFTSGMRYGLGLAEAANESRRCSETPPNICTPSWMASQARALARKYDNVTVRVISGQQLEKEKLFGHINVGQASVNKPCMIRIEYKPKRAKKGAGPAVLVGKTITYDTGGLSLKPSNSMKGMKYDMDGGAAVLGAMHAIAGVVKPDRPVVALLASAENCVSSNAYRPDDVIEFRNGVTVEVTNTDAEGRLVLADALCWACDKEKPDFVVDMATLTGGVITALGSTYAGAWSNDEDLFKKVQAAAERADEPVWRLPMDQPYRDMMKSEIADVLNSNPNRKAHATQGAAFLSYFVKENVPWCHIDIAGMHGAESDDGMCAKGTATGFGTRLAADLIAMM